MHPFANRTEAGKILAERLRPFEAMRPVVLALPRGGLPVAREIARVLSAPLDILAVKKIGAPMNPEVAIGAISEDEEPVFNEDLIGHFPPESRAVKKIVREKRAELQAQVSLFRGKKSALPVTGRTVILVDDGLATGSTMEAAVKVLRRREPVSIVLAVPVAAREAIAKLRPFVEDLICLVAPEDFQAVGQWYRDFRQVSNEEAMAMIEDDPPAPASEDAIVGEIRRLARPLPNGGARKLAAALANRRVVMLGEATHGSEEFYRWRSEISRVLIEEHGFQFIAVEGDWPDLYQLHGYVTGRAGKGARRIMESFARWPTWLWANEPMLELVQWMRNHRAGLFGLDVYSLHESIRVIRRHALRFGGEKAAEILARYDCFAPYERDEIAYVRSLIGDSEGCREDTAANLRAILETRLADTRFHEDELFDLAQNALVIKNAESYYRAMLRGDAASWNVRDRHMLETLSMLLQRYGPASKGIVWAHNTHIGDYRATDMQGEGYVNLGGLAREQWGEDAVALVGFGTFGGRVRAGRAWAAEEENMRLPNARRESYEARFHAASAASGWSEFFCLMERGESPLRTVLGHRAVGVVYSAAAELSGRNYVPTDLAARYDAFIWIDRTEALRSFRTRPQPGLMPESWPSAQ